MKDLGERSWGYNIEKIFLNNLLENYFNHDGFQNYLIVHPLLNRSRLCNLDYSRVTSWQPVDIS